MTVASWFFSTTTPDNYKYLAPAVGAAAGSHHTTLNSGTATNISNDAFELRISTGISGNPTSITKEMVEEFLEKCRDWLWDGEQGLDALIKANSGTVGIP